MLAVGWAAALLGREALPVLVPTIMTELSVTSSQVGLAMSVMWALYAVSQYPGGRLSDRLNRRTVVIVSLSFLSLGFLLLSVTRTYLMLVFALVFVGSGSGLYFPAVRGWLADLFSERRNQVFGIHTAAGSVGGSLSAGLVILMLAHASWSVTFVPTMLLLLLVAVTIHKLGHEPYAARRVQLEIRPTIARLLRDGEIRRLLLVYSLFAFVWQGAISFFPLFLQSQKGLSPTIASAGYASLFAFGIIMGPLAGRLADSFTSLSVATVSLLLCSLGLLLLVVGTSLTTVALGTFCLAIGGRSYPPVMQSFVMDTLPEDSAAGDFGGLKMVYTSLGSLGPVYIGSLSGAFGFVPGFASLMGASMIAVVGLWSLAHH